MTVDRLQVNGKDIVVPNPWSQFDFIQNIYTEFGTTEVQVQDALIRDPKCSEPGPRYEVIDAVVEMSSPTHGLQSLHLNGFP